MFDVLLLIIVSTAVLAKTYALTMRGYLSSAFVTAIFLYHTLFSVFYYFLAKTMPADANMYFRVGTQLAESSHANADFKPGTQFILWLVEHLLELFPLQKMTVFLIFGYFGFLGLMYVLLAFRAHMTSKTMRFYQLVLLLPGISFWTSSLGKDSLIFLPLCYLLYALNQSNVVTTRMFLAVALIFMIRPHVGMVVMLCMGMSLLFSGKQISLMVKGLTLAIVSAAGVVIFPLVATYVGLDDLSVQGVSEKIEGRAEHNQTGGGAVNLTELSLPAQMFAYMFRPFFFDAKGLLGLIVSVENLVYFSMFLFMCRPQFIKFVRTNSGLGLTFSLFFCVTMTLMMATTTANSGIAIRQKLMYFPFFIFVFMWFASWLELQLVNVARTSTPAGVK